MFLQKLNLKNNKSYKTSTTLENLIENLQITFNHIQIITPFSSQSESYESIIEKLKEDKSVSKMDINTYLKIDDSYKCSHAIILEKDIIEKFGIDLSILKRPFITIGNDSNLPNLHLCRFAIKNKEEDAFVALFILSKIFSGTVIANKPEKLKIFFKVFDISWSIIEPNKFDGNIEGECLVIMDNIKDLIENKINDIERVFCIGFVPKAYEVFNIDLALAGKYKYRIGDVYRSITTAVIKGYKEFDYSRFANLKP